MTVSERLEYMQEIDRDEVKFFVDYENQKEQIDALTGHNNLDFKYEKAEISEYVVRITTLDGRHIFLPIPITDGEGLHADGFLHRALTREETEAKREYDEKRKVIKEKIENLKARGRIHEEK